MQEPDIFLDRINYVCLRRFAKRKKDVKIQNAGFLEIVYYLLSAENGSRIL